MPDRRDRIEGRQRLPQPDHRLHVAALELDHLVGHRVLVVEGGDADPETGLGALTEPEGGLPQPVEDVDSRGRRIEGPLHEIGRDGEPGRPLPRRRLPRGSVWRRRESTRTPTEARVCERVVVDPGDLVSVITVICGRTCGMVHLHPQESILRQSPARRASSRHEVFARLRPLRTQRRRAAQGPRRVR